MEKKGGVSEIRDFERNAILDGEGSTKSWQEKLLGTPGSSNAQTLPKLVMQLSGITGKVWVRQDGAVARINSATDILLLDLSQARKFEAERKMVKEQTAHKAAPAF